VETTWLPNLERRPRRVAVGEFDGVHIGHREVIAGADTVLTFEPHPLAVIKPSAAPRLITTAARRAELIADLGVQELVLIPFDRDFSELSAEEFVEQVLVERLAASHVSVGENFRYGARAQGDAQTLERDSRFATRIAPLVEVDGEIVSSSHIRALVGAGDVREAATRLGAPFQLRGEVVHGDKRGRELGYPTANLVPDERSVCPGHGVYACVTSAGTAGGAGGRIPAAVNVGVRPTFTTGRGLLVEAFLLDWSGDLYGEELRLDFLARLRGERRFGSVDALVAQMARDVDDARGLTASLSPL